MIISNRWHITRMRPDRGDNAEIVVSTAKEGLFKGLSTQITNTVPFHAVIAKIIYMSSMKKEDIHAFHDALVTLIDNNLRIMCPLEIAIADGLDWARDSGCTQQVGTADWFAKGVAETSASFKGRTITQINKEQQQVRRVNNDGRTTL